MKSSSKADQQISSLWFYLFSAFFSIVGVAGFFSQNTPLWARIPLGLAFLFVGLSFLLEPLKRKNKLPHVLAQLYESFTSSFGQTRSSARTTSLIISLAAGVTLIFFCSDAAFGPSWSTVRIYMVGLVAFFAIFFVFMAVTQMLQDWGPDRLRQSRITTYVAALSQIGSQMRLQPNARSISNFIFTWSCAWSASMQRLPFGKDPSWVLWHLS
jgi:hypothetical protein